MENAPSIHAYFDYREYLKSWVAWRRTKDLAFSWRRFQEEADISGSAYLNRVVSGSRKLSPVYCEKLLCCLKLTKKDADYLRQLVLFQNEGDPEKKDIELRRLLQLRSRQGEGRLKDRKLKYFEKWYYPVIRSLLVLEDFGEDWKWLARSVVPAIQASQAKSAVKFLLEEGFVRKGKNGSYETVKPVLATPPSVHSTLLTRFHRKNLELNLGVFQKLSPKERPFSSVTMSVSQRGFDRIRDEVSTFRQRLLSLLADDEAPDRVVHVGFQILPRGKIKGREK